jgi:protoporphyrinogen oxidase
VSRLPVVVLGAGPSGLGAAYQLAGRSAFDVTVLERAPFVGGNAGSFELDGIPVDFGSHRLHPACAPEILSDIRAMLGDDLLARPRHGRIRLRERWLHFPLKPIDLALQLPPSFAAGVVFDAARKTLGGTPSGEETFATVLERGLGRTICRDFYFPYARKIWGVDPSTLDAEQARRRVAAGSLAKMIRKVAGAIPGLKPKGQGIFYYPRGGFGQISRAYGDAAVKRGARVLLNSRVDGLEVEGNRVVAVQVSDAAGSRRLPSRQVLSTIPLTMLVQLLRPSAPAELLAEARALDYRAMLLVYLVLDTDQFTEYDAHYFPEPGVAITRLSEPKNYGLRQCPGTTVLCAEYPCSPSDAVWTETDDQLGGRVLKALEAAGIPVRCRVRRVESRRLAQAYPIYTRDYRTHFDRLDAFVGGIDGLVTFGRQGLFAHDNTHHTLAMAYAANECLADDGGFDRARWSSHRRAFESHVVED